MASPYSPEELAQMQESPRKEQRRQMRDRAAAPPTPDWPPSPQLAPFIGGTPPPLPGQLGLPGQTAQQPVPDMEAAMQRTFYNPAPANITGTMPDSPTPPLPNADNGAPPQIDKTPMPDSAAPNLKAMLTARLKDVPISESGPDLASAGAPPTKAFPSPDAALTSRFQPGSPGNQLLPPDAEARLFDKAAPTGSQVSPDDALGAKIKAGFGSLGGGYNAPMAGLTPEYAPGSPGANVQDRLAQIGQQMGASPEQMKTAGTGAPSPEMAKMLAARTPDVVPGSDNSPEAMAARRGGQSANPDSFKRTILNGSGQKVEVMDKGKNGYEGNDAKTARENLDTSTPQGQEQMMRLDRSAREQTKSDSEKAIADYAIGSQRKVDEHMQKFITLHPEADFNRQLKEREYANNLYGANPGGATGTAPAAGQAKASGIQPPPVQHSLHAAFGSDIGPRLQSIADQDPNSNDLAKFMVQAQGMAGPSFTPENVGKMLPFLEQRFTPEKVREFMSPGTTGRVLDRLFTGPYIAGQSPPMSHAPLGEAYRRSGLFGAEPSNEDKARAVLRAHLQMANRYPYKVE